MPHGAIINLMMGFLDFLDVIDFLDLGVDALKLQKRSRCLDIAKAVFVFDFDFRTARTYVPELG